MLLLLLCECFTFGKIYLLCAFYDLEDLLVCDCISGSRIFFVSCWSTYLFSMNLVVTKTTRNKRLLNKTTLISATFCETYDIFTLTKLYVNFRVVFYISNWISKLPTESNMACIIPILISKKVFILPKCSLLKQSQITNVLIFLKTNVNKHVKLLLFL